MNALRPTQHHMGRRAFTHDYSRPGIYHITIHVADGMGQPLCRTKDTWWKEAAPNDAVPSGFPAGTTPEQKRNNKTQDK